MKELTIEQKAQRYDEALAKARNIVNSINVGLIGKDSFEAVFPELIESDDKKWIPKEIIKYLKEKGDFRSCWIAWLEAQGEHTNFRNAIQVGDKVTRNEDGVLVNLSQLKRVAKKDEKQGEKKPADKVEPKFKVGDEIKTKNEESFTITRIDRWGYWSEDLFICDFDDADKWELVEQKTACGEKNKKLWVHDDDIFLDAAKMIVEDSPRKSYGGVHKKEIVPWFLSLKERLKSLKDRVQPKQEWSEEDERMISDIDNCIKNLPILYETIKINGEDKTTKQFVYCARNWLKSLRPQSQWKPSDEQMEALEYFIVYHNDSTNYAKDLEELRLQLKKLRED